MQPGHIFPLMAQDGGVLVRAGHTEACCDLARLAGLTPAAVLCEIMSDDGSMARLPDLLQFAAEHKLKIGTIADLIEYRSRNESLVQRGAARDIETPWGEFHLVPYRDLAVGSLHLALVAGQDRRASTETLVRVHEPLSVLDLLDVGSSTHSWGVGDALQAIQQAGSGVDGAAELQPAGRAARGSSSRRSRRKAGRSRGPAPLRHRRADPARPRRRAHAPDGRAAQDAEHGGLRPGGGRAIWALRARRRSADAMRLGIVASRFNEEISGELLKRARDAARKLGVEFDEKSVPGALEIPLALQWMAQSGRYDALVAVGAVIRGETYHFEVVCNESARGVMDVALESGLPVANGILTTERRGAGEGAPRQGRRSGARRGRDGEDCGQASTA